MPVLSAPGKRDAPRIAGSEAGFIALVIGLSVFILASSLAIYLLARRTGPRYRAPSPSPSAPWFAKLSRLFARRGSGAPDAPKPRKGGHGWVQASGDAWEADEVDRTREIAPAGLGLGRGLDAPFRPPPVTDPYAPAPSESYSSDSLAYDPHPQPYTPKPASRSTLSTTHTSPTSPTALPRSTSPESISAVHFADDTRRSATAGSTRSQDRHFSIDSVASIQTFEGGTKFIEGL